MRNVGYKMPLTTQSPRTTSNPPWLTFADGADGGCGEDRHFWCEVSEGSVEECRCVGRSGGECGGVEEDLSEVMWVLVSEGLCPILIRL
jgi:hypothetical protein